MAAGFHLGGVASITHTVRLAREATRICVPGGGLFLASLLSAAAEDTLSEIFTGLEASTNHKRLFGRGLRFRQGTVRGRLACPGGRRARPLRLSGNAVRRDLSTTF